MPDYYDAREIIQWETITLELTSTGSYSFQTGGSTYNGSLTGSDSATLTRRDFDRSKEATEAEQLSGNAFVTCREIRSLHSGTDGPPIIFLLRPVLGDIGAGAFTKTEPGGTESSTDTFFSLYWTDKDGADWGEPSTLFSVSASIETPTLGRFANGLGIDEYLSVNSGLTVPWRTSDLPHTLTATKDYTILAPYFSVTPAPGEVMGSGTITLSAVFA